MRDTHRVLMLNQNGRKFRIHATLDSMHSLWSLRYDAPAVLPPGLQGRWTSFERLTNFLKDYYARRKIKVEEIID